MDSEPFITTVLLNQETSIPALIDTGCLAYGLINERLVQKLQLPRISIQPRAIQSVDKVTAAQIHQVTHVTMDISGYKKDVHFYIVPRIEEYQLILGRPWTIQEKVIIDDSRDRLMIQGTLEVPNESRQPYKQQDYKPISANGFTLLTQGKQRQKVQVFTASIKDIEKALSKFNQAPTDPTDRLPDWIPEECRMVFDKTESNRLPPHRPDVDHAITLEKNSSTGITPQAPWGPLYNMSREELLVLRKTLTDYLSKGFIRVSSSPAAAPVLFVKKPGGGLRFCCDYRALNKITRKDRYPLPLIHETLNQISKAKWFTKLDVVSAFHRIRIKEGDEWLTAFRTRFGLYEWLVTPFGLANAPSTFQRYINWTLREFLDDFVSAYVDDVLIFTDGTKSEHRKQVLQVLQKLQDAGLQLDIDKCEFEVQSTKYLGFIIDAEEGIKMDPVKVQAIVDWQPPTTVKGVQSFLGFSNFYRTFIQDYSALTAPLHRLTHKDTVFKWSMDAQQAFERLKQAFTTAPVLAQFDPDDETILETDSSGWAIGGILSQYKNGILRPIAYFSQKNSPAECNYEIYDKEMLAIIKCLKEWGTELQSVQNFTILTDHKNLEYFTTIRQLSERQMRWQLILSRFNFVLQYRPGKLSQKPDILSRREQDLVQGQDERLSYREVCLLPKELIKATTIRATPVAALMDPTLPLETLWEEAIAQDEEYARIKETVQRQARQFSSDLRIKVSISECSISNQGNLLYRERKWVPNYEPLRTKIIQLCHDSPLTAHPGRDGTLATVLRQYFWPNMSQDVRQFTRNCDHCGRTKVWRDLKYGLLRPLSVPDQIWKEISMDFIGPLPKTQSGHDCILVITDRLGKGVIIEPCSKTDAESLTRLFIRSFYRHHGLPNSITSDRGPQFISEFWRSLCTSLNIQQRLSTGFHPQTDGSTERANSEIERILRLWTNYEQNDWDNWLPLVELALNGRTSSTTKVSPFFLTHGYHLDPILEPTTTVHYRNENVQQQARQIQDKLRKVKEWANVNMTAAQQEQERQANKLRRPSPAYKVGDKVWLKLTNIQTTRPSKKLDDKAAKYTVTEVVGPHSYRLNVPGNVHNVFHVDLLHPVADDPFPSQQRSNYQPPAIVENGESVYLVDKIITKRMHRLPGRRRIEKQYLVKWTGYDQPTWEPEDNVYGTEALNIYRQREMDRV